MLTLKQNKEFEEKLGIEPELVRVIDVPLNKLRNEILKEKGKVVVLGGDEKVNRFCVENKKVDILLSPELNTKKDSFHYRKSG